jgi:uncharacterized protein (TIGR00255 family)
LEDNLFSKDSSNSSLEQQLLSDSFMTENTVSSTVHSMTGFGRAVLRNEEETIEVDARSVNHKTFKSSVRVPDHLLSLLPKIEQRLKSALSRGSVSFHFRHRRAGGQSVFKLNEDQLLYYVNTLKELAKKTATGTISLSDLVALPGTVLELGSEPLDMDLVWAAIEPVLDEALNQLIQMRADEGHGIANDLRQALADIERHRQLVVTLIPETLQNYQEKLKARIAKLLGASSVEPDPKELAQQIAFFADRSDISEELQRVSSHVDSFRKTMNKGGVMGRKLEFIGQEMQREANTMISKSHGLEIVNSILSIKLAVERIREQCANVE